MHIPIMAPLPFFSVLALGAPALARPLNILQCLKAKDKGGSRYFETMTCHIMWKKE